MKDLTKTNSKNNIFQDYEETLNYIYNLKRFGSKLNLRSIKTLLHLLGNPEKGLRVVHVAGTNGKGSTCAMVGSILQEAGYKVGIFTSPHLIKFGERIVVNRRQISEEKVLELADAILKQCKSMEVRGLGHPTFFEVVTAMAFLYFKEQDVDFAVLEVGMGGRLDATNVADSLVSVITSISLDHTNVLGNATRKIAKEKAGIIKHNRITITSATGHALSVIKRTCQRKKNRLFCVGKDITYKRKRMNIRFQEFDVKGICGTYENLKTPLLGEHQLVNASCAIGAVESLNEYGFITGENAIRKGLKKVEWPGRFEIIQKLPVVVLDGAHNPDGMRCLKKTLLELFDRKEITLVLGISSDKDISSMLKEITHLASKVIVTRHNVMNRSVDPLFLKKSAEKYTKDVLVEKDIKTAVQYAKQIANNKGGVVCVTGSLFTVGEAREMWLPSLNKNILDRRELQ